MHNVKFSASDYTIERMSIKFVLKGTSSPIKPRELISTCTELNSVDQIKTADISFRLLVTKLGSMCSIVYYVFDMWTDGHRYNMGDASHEKVKRVTNIFEI